MVDSVGNRLGPRKTFVYITDGSVNRNIVLDESVATALGNTPSTNSGFARIYVSAGEDIKPRYVILALKSDPTVKKKAVICDYTNSLYLTSVATEVSINNVIWVVTARIGERRLTLQVDDPPP